jgi:hypothetical protein
VDSQPAGAWGQAAGLPGIAGLSSGRGGQLTKISCASAGNCSAAGSYHGPGSTSLGFLADEVNGSWGAAQALPDPARLGNQGSSITAISCPSAGNCAALGADSSSLFILDEVNGSWGDPLAVPGLASLGAASDGEVDSLSCPDMGDCTAIGTVIGSGGAQAAFMVTETGGTWRDATLVAGVAALSTLGSWGAVVSCPAAGNCTAIGGYEPARLDWLVWVADEVNGSWGSAQQLAAPATTLRATALLSCATPGNCAVEGNYDDAGLPHAFVANDVNGAWQPSRDVPGLSGVESGADAISCAAPGDCAATGSYQVSGRNQEYATDEVNGIWGTAGAIPGVPAAAPEITGLSCTAPGYCTAVGDLVDGRSLVSEANGTATTVTVGAAKVSYGDEQTAPVSVSVTSQAGDTPTGTVTVTTTPLDPTVTDCTVTLIAGTGKCTLPAAALVPGSYHLTAIYNGDTSDAASASAVTAALTVTPAATTTSLALSGTKALYGHESVIRLSTVTTPQHGGPITGRVTIQVGSRAVCSFGLTAGRGSCLLPDTALGVGASHLTAYAYPNGSFTASVSASRAVTIVKGSDTTTLTLSKPVLAYGHENAGKLSVRVRPQYHGTPVGRVIIKAGSVTLCVINLRADVGSCVLAARQLRAGTYEIVASYEGNASFAVSTSRRASLKVT